MNRRQYTLFDNICLSLDQGLRAMTSAKSNTGRAYPAENEIESKLSEKERKHSAGLMRVNHTGEVCAQALYHGQGLASRSIEIKDQMKKAADEEGDHLAWCHTRLCELNSHTSYLNPFWYVGSFTLGLTAGMIGDRFSLGFLAETEQQVVRHLEEHIQLLKNHDQRSFKIIAQMQQDEAEHRNEAIKAGAVELPWILKKLMQLTSKVMVKTAYWI